MSAIAQHGLAHVAEAGQDIVERMLVITHQRGIAAKAFRELVESDDPRQRIELGQVRIAPECPVDGGRHQNPPKWFSWSFSAGLPVERQPH